jgi:hypothetical protein
MSPGRLLLAAFVAGALTGWRPRRALARVVRDGAVRQLLKYATGPGLA